MPHHPFQRQAGNDEHEEVDGSRAIVIKWEVFLFPLNGGSSYLTKSLVVTLKIIRCEAGTSVPIRTKLSDLKPKHLDCKSKFFISLKEFEVGSGKQGKP